MRHVTCATDSEHMKSPRNLRGTRTNKFAKTAGLWNIEKGEEVGHSKHSLTKRDAKPAHHREQHGSQSGKLLNPSKHAKKCMRARSVRGYYNQREKRRRERFVQTRTQKKGKTENRSTKFHHQLFSSSSGWLKEHHGYLESLTSDAIQKFFLLQREANLLKHYLKIDSLFWEVEGGLSRRVQIDDDTSAIWLYTSFVLERRWKWPSERAFLSNGKQCSATPIGYERSPGGYARFFDRFRDST